MPIRALRTGPAESGTSRRERTSSSRDRRLATIFGASLAAVALTAVSTAPAHAETQGHWIVSGCVGALEVDDTDGATSFSMSEMEWITGHACRATVRDLTTDTVVADAIMTGTPVAVFLPDGAYQVEFSDETWDTSISTDVTVLGSTLPELGAFASEADSCATIDTRRAFPVPTSKGVDLVDEVWTVFDPRPSCSEDPQPGDALTASIPIAVLQTQAPSITASVSGAIVGDTVEYTVAVTNASRTPFALTGAADTSTLLVVCTSGALPSLGASDCTATYTITPEDRLAGSVTQRFTVTGVDSGLDGRIGETGVSATTGTASITTAVPNRTITITGDAPDLAAGDPIDYQYVVEGEPTPSVRVIAGALPAGVTLSASGRLTGTASVAATSTFTIEASNGIDDPVTLDDSIDVSAPITVTPAPGPLPTTGAPAQRLATTGVDPALAAGSAAIVILLGAVLAVQRRRPRRAE